MNSSVCKDLERAFESRRRDYIATRSSVYSRVSTGLAAYKNVEMERAKNGLEERQSVCVFAASGPMAHRLDSTFERHAESI
jgi:hypothetical protein